MVDPVFWKWKFDGKMANYCNLYICSNCGCPGNKNWNFCPSCGVPMNEKALEILRKREGDEK